MTGETFEEAEITGPINWQLFGETLFDHRNKSKLNQQELENRVGVSTTVIRYIENAPKRPGRKTLLRLLSIPELQLKVHDVTRRSAAESRAETGWIPNSWLAPRYDPVQMLSELNIQRKSADKIPLSAPAKYGCHTPHDWEEPFADTVWARSM